MNRQRRRPADPRPRVLGRRGRPAGLPDADRRPRARGAGPRGPRGDFITVACFDAQGTASSRALKKGARIGVAGRLEYHEWKAGDGSVRSRHETIGESVEFLDPHRK